MSWIVSYYQNFTAKTPGRGGNGGLPFLNF